MLVVNRGGADDSRAEGMKERTREPGSKIPRMCPPLRGYPQIKKSCCPTTDYTARAAPATKW